MEQNTTLAIILQYPPLRDFCKQAARAVDYAVESAVVSYLDEGVLAGYGSFEHYRRERSSARLSCSTIEKAVDWPANTLRNSEGLILLLHEIMRDHPKVASVADDAYHFEIGIHPAVIRERERSAFITSITKYIENYVISHYSQSEYGRAKLTQFRGFVTALDERAEKAGTVRWTPQSPNCVHGLGTIMDKRLMASITEQPNGPVFRPCFT